MNAKGKYLGRIVDEELEFRLQAKGAVLVEGPKWCGKTTTAAYAARSVVSLLDPKSIEQNLSMAALDPLKLLAGPVPRLIDEWQVAPNLWDAVRFEVDQRGEMGQFILTGSAVPAADMSHSHSGTGRIARMRMRPMTLSESGESSREYSLTALFDGTQQETGVNPLDFDQLLFALCRGGWPMAVKMRGRAALQQAFDYVDAVVESDLSRADGIKRDPARVRSVLRSLARFSATSAKNTHILADLTMTETNTLSIDTLAQYLRSLERIFVLEPLAGWNPALRSKAAIRSTPTTHFVDPSLAVAALRIGPSDLLKDLETAGLFFESMCVRDLRVYAQSLDGDVFHYRDNVGREVDAVVHLRDGRWGLFEVKLSDQRADEAAAKLLNVVKQINIEKMNPPSVLGVITAGRYAYQRPDGVHVIPLPCLTL